MYRVSLHGFLGFMVTLSYWVSWVSWFHGFAGFVDVIVSWVSWFHWYLVEVSWFC